VFLIEFRSAQKQSDNFGGKPVRKIHLSCAAALIIAAFLTLNAQSGNSPRYELPPRAVIEAFDTPPLPQAILSPSKQTIALLYRRPYPTIAELSRPMLRLAGSRINPRTNGTHLTARIFGITFKRISDGAETKVAVPSQPNISNVSFSPDGARLSFLNTTADRVELWVADVAPGRARSVTGLDRLNGTDGDPCEWLHDNVTVICELVPIGRGPVPAESAVPTGPNVQENQGKPAPVPTYEDMLKTAHDDALFEYYFTSQIASFNVTTGRKTIIGRPAIFDGIAMSPNDDYLLVSKVKRPFSHLLPKGGFPEDVEIWTRRGELVHKIADVPSSESVPINGVVTGPRAYRWRPDQPASVVWVEALDGGDLKNKAPFRDKIMTLASPFKGAATEMARTEWRYAGMPFTEKGTALLNEFDRSSRR